MRKGCLIGAALGLIMLAGCGMGDSGMEVQVAPAELAPALAENGGALSLPGGRTFNIHLKNSTQTPGAIGKARGDSDASPDGQAFCLADASNGGSAGAEFKVGHRVVTGENSSWRASIHLEFQLRQSLQVSAQPLPKTLGTGQLEILVLNARKRVLARSALATFTSDDSVGSATESHDRTLSVMLEPRDTCDIIVFGKVEASAAQGQETTVRLDLRQLKMNIEVRPAATQPSTAIAGTQPAI